jgi:phosphatidylglycerophosphatase A
MASTSIMAIWWLTEFVTILYKLDIQQQVNDMSGNHDECKISTAEILSPENIQREMFIYLEIGSITNQWLCQYYKQQMTDDNMMT